MTFAGVPAASETGGTSRVTTAPAATVQRRLDVHAPLDTSEYLTQQPEPLFGIARVARAERRHPPACFDGHARELGVVAVVTLAGEHLLPLSEAHGIRVFQSDNAVLICRPARAQDGHIHRGSCV